MDKTKISHWILDNLLLLILITTVIIFQIQGKYTDKQIIMVETCQDIITPTGQQTLLDYNITITQTPRGGNTTWDLTNTS